MDRAITIVVCLLIAVIVLPAVAQVAQAIVPPLVALLVVLGALRLALPPSRRRR